VFNQAISDSIRRGPCVGKARSDHESVGMKPMHRSCRVSACWSLTSSAEIMADAYCIGLYGDVFGCHGLNGGGGVKGKKKGHESSVSSVSEIPWGQRKKGGVGGSRHAKHAALGPIRKLSCSNQKARSERREAERAASRCRCTMDGGPSPLPSSLSLRARLIGLDLTPPRVSRVRLQSKGTDQSLDMTP
jgi:hypothetical protein